MKRNNTLERRIRGWFPQEPKFPSRNSPIHLLTKPKPQRKKWSIGVGILLPAATTFIFISLLMQISTAAIALLVVIFAFLVGAALLSRASKQRLYRIFKYGTFLVMALGAFIAVLGIILFSTSGYPQTIVPQTSYPQILDASLTGYLQNVEDSSSFRFLQAEHLGTVSFTGLTISTTFSNTPENLGGLDWSFYASDVNVKVSVGQTTSIPYRISTNSYSPFQGSLLPDNFPSPENVNASLEQINTLGLRWFHDQAVNLYKNQAGTDPAITNLNVKIAFDEDYNCMTLLLRGGYQSHDQRNNPIYPSYFTAEFQPNGTLLNFKVTPL
jgi:hypothetical protein